MSWAYNTYLSRETVQVMPRPLFDPWPSLVKFADTLDHSSSATRGHCYPRLFISPYSLHALYITSLSSFHEKCSSTYCQLVGVGLDFLGWLAQLLGFQRTDNLDFENMLLVRSLFAVTFLS